MPLAIVHRVGLATHPRALLQVPRIDPEPSSTADHPPATKNAVPPPVSRRLTVETNAPVRPVSIPV
jgi:hypothetical protein